MECISPLNLPRPNGRGTTDRITVPCGKCLSCLSLKRQQWHFRLSQELKQSTGALFLTLQYAETDGNVNKDHVQKWLKKLRKAYDLRYNPALSEIMPKNGLKPARIRYYLTAEYGTKTFRPHYHVILFNVSHKDRDIIDKSWNHGYVFYGDVTAESIGYVVKYCITEHDDTLGLEKTFSLMSKNPGLGLNYMDKTKDYHAKGEKFTTTLLGGQKIPLPRYYRDKLFTSVQKVKNNIRQKKLSDEKREKRFNEISQNENPFNYDFQQKSQWIETARKRLNKNSKI